MQKIYIFVLLLIGAYSLTAQADKSNDLGVVYLKHISDPEKQAVGEFIYAKTRFRYEYDNDEILPVLNDVFEHEDEYFLEISRANVIGDIVVEQRTVTTIYLSNEGPTTATNVQEFSGWSPLDEFASYQYRLNKLVKITPKNLLDRLLQDESLSEGWKDVAKSCPQQDVDLGYSSCSEVYSIEVRVFIKPFRNKKKIGEIEIESPYGC